MNKDLKDKWKQAESTGQPVEVGRIVVCDVCNEDYTERTDQGGFLFGSYGYCPACAVRSLSKIIEYGEEGHIKARCPAGMAFADWIRQLRGPNAAIQIRGFKP